MGGAVVGTASDTYSHSPPPPDYQNEFFYNRTTKQLYIFYNGTGAPPADIEWVVPQTKVLFNM